MKGLARIKWPWLLTPVVLIPIGNAVYYGGDHSRPLAHSRYWITMGLGVVFFASLVFVAVVLVAKALDPERREARRERKIWR